VNTSVTARPHCFAALNILNGAMLGRCMQKHTHQELIRFLNAVERAVRVVQVSVLWLADSNSWAKANRPREATPRCIAHERLVFAPRLPLLSEHLARDRLADFLLDSLPYNARATTSDALGRIAGVHLRRYYLWGRVAGSLLRAIGLGERLNHRADA
jgi:protein O-GlcNAc transferase